MRGILSVLLAIIAQVALLAWLSEKQRPPRAGKTHQTRVRLVGSRRLGGEERFGRAFKSSIRSMTNEMDSSP